MAEAGSYTENCFFNGSASSSTAEPGPCTDTAGYISNAEINDIVANASRVTTSYVDEGSHSNILVYDSTNWVAYMDDSIKAERETLFQGLEMGGSGLQISHRTMIPLIRARIGLILSTWLRLGGILMPKAIGPGTGR